jgi:beta propeller repeat protein
MIRLQRSPFPRVGPRPPGRPDAPRHAPSDHPQPTPRRPSARVPRLRRPAVPALPLLPPLLLAVLLALPQATHAAQQFQGLCSLVKIEIIQELALERIGFLATLEVTNNEGDASLTDFSAALTFQFRPPGETQYLDASDRFFVQPPEIQGINAVDGTGIIRPGETAQVSWFIIPKIAAGGESADGLVYRVGAELGGALYGEPLPADVLAVIPDRIRVLPEPQLDITYFQPRDVDGDDPFTPEIVEAPIPFTLGVLVRNQGFGPARNVRINSEQPRIVENEQGLLVVPRLLGARVDDQPTDDTSLKVELGDIEPSRCRKGAWDMITSLSGEFTEFKASYTHASELGGRDTSIITDLNAYFMVQEVLNDQPGRDDLLDFLAETQGGEELIPDALYESDCNVLPVNQLSQVEVASYAPASRTAVIDATADFENWVFLRVDDPAQAKYAIESVVRSDGKLLDPHNYWTHIRYRESDNAKLTWLNIFDFVALGEYSYTVTYAPPEDDNEPPVTRLRFVGEAQEQAGRYYILPDTQLFFTVEDASPVGTYLRLDDEVEFRPAYPFWIAQAGEHQLSFYSEDAAGNREAEQQVTLVVVAAHPQLASLDASSEPLFVSGDALSIRPDRRAVNFQGLLYGSRLDARVDVYRGVYGAPTLTGVPSTPTPQADATLTVGGVQVDHYRWRLNGGAWSEERDVAQPIELNGLAGLVVVDVLGRSSHGDYPDPDQALSVGWQVADTPVWLTGNLEQPAATDTAVFDLVGSDTYCWRIDGSFYRPETQPGEPIELTGLAPGEHQVEVLPRANQSEACPADAPGASSLTWLIDRGYGYRLPAEQQVRGEDLGQVDDIASSFHWDGRDDAGVPVPAGWYSVMVSLTDDLGRTGNGIVAVEVADLLAAAAVLDDGDAPQARVRAAGHWAVWQDQRAGNWDILAQNLRDSAPALVIADGPLNQERPDTDGRILVWQDRRPDGNWDIWWTDLTAGTANAALTATADLDETRPAVDWPWVVYQQRPSGDDNAPWQVIARHLLDGTSISVDPTTQDQLDPRLHRGRVVWQDFRDPGYGEIYLADLRNGDVRRITTDPGGQYHPDIADERIVWSDNRNTQLDLYGFDLRRGVEQRLTDSPQDETRPALNGPWVVYADDAGGEQGIDLRLMHWAGGGLQLSNSGGVKQAPVLADGQVLWIDGSGAAMRVHAAPLPDLQPVFNNNNAIVVTTGMADYLGDAMAC